MKANIATRPMSAAPAWRTRLVWLAIRGLFLEQRDEAPELDAALLEVVVGVEAGAGGREKDDVAGLGAGHRRLERLGQRRQAVDGQVGGLRGAGGHRPRLAGAEEWGAGGRRPPARVRPAGALAAAAVTLATLWKPRNGISAAGRTASVRPSRRQ